MQLNFNAFDYDPSQSGGICFPLGDYKVEITAAEPKVVKDNPSAGFLELSLTVTEGDLRGMVQKDRLNIFHTNDVAKRIANQRLAAYCFAINRPYVQETTQLLGGRCIITAGPQVDSEKYSEVKVVKCLDGTLPSRPANGQQQAAPPAAPPAPVAPPVPQQAAPQAPASAQAAPPWGNAPAAAAQAPASAAPVPPWAR